MFANSFIDVDEHISIHVFELRIEVIMNYDDRCSYERYLRPAVQA